MQKSTLETYALFKKHCTNFARHPTTAFVTNTTPLFNMCSTVYSKA